MLNDLSIIIPARNEKENIEVFLPELKKICSDIIVVDGHSNDGTSQLCDEKKVTYLLDNKLGKGDAQRLAANKAKYENIIFFDGDGSHDINDIPKIYNLLIHGNDSVLTSRITGGSLDVVSNNSLIGFIRFTGSNLITLIFNKLFKSNFTETLYSFRGIKKKVFLDLMTQENGFGIEIEMIYLLIKNKKKIIEIPSRERKRIFGISKLNTFSGVYFIYQCIKYYFKNKFNA